jgi:hypothetical protein
MSKRRKPDRWPAEKPLYIRCTVEELENELTVGQELPPIVERVSANPDDPPNLGGQTVPLTKKATPPPTQDPA